MNSIPDTWLDVTLGDVIDYGVTEKVEPSEIAPETWVLELEDIEKDTGKVVQRLTFAQRQSKSTKTRFRCGDVLYGKLRPYLNKVVFANEPGVCTTEIIPIRQNEAVLARYLFHWLRHPTFRAYVTDVSHGVNMPRLGTDAGKNAPFVLAPRLEQQRIVDKLDTVLARVDAVNDRLASVAPLLKRFRQAVLAAASCGRLTADWRDDSPNQANQTASLGNVQLPSGYKRLSKQTFKLVKIPCAASDLPDTWRVCTVADLYNANVLIDFADGNHGSLYPRKEDFGAEGVLFLTATQMSELWHVSLSDSPRLNSSKANQLTKGWAKDGDVLLSHNATVGRVGILDSSDKDVLLGTSVTFYRFNLDHFSNRFARVLFSSQFFQKQLRSVMEQTTRDQVPITKQVSLNVLVPPIQEQREIARRVELLFAFADRLEARLQTARTAASRLTSSLLAKAFRGELVQQDLNDEPASVLLQRLAATPSTKAQSTRGRPRTQPVVPITSPAPLAPVPIDWRILPNNEWAAPAASQEQAITVCLTAVLRAWGQPMPEMEARLATLLCKQPRVFTALLPAAQAKHWGRLVGEEAKPFPAQVTPLQPASNIPWGQAIKRMRARGDLIETGDGDDTTWSLGPSASAITTAGWPDGRASFVVTHLRAHGVASILPALEPADQAFVHVRAA